jgi:hypothetical protein
LVGAVQGVQDDVPQELGLVSETHAPEQLCVPAAHTQVPDPLQVPLVGVVQAPEVRGPTLHTEVVPEHTRVPVCAQPPVPAEVHAPEATHTPPQFW